jgi:flagellin
LVSEIQTALTNTEKYTNGVDQNSHLAFVGTANIPGTSVIWDTANDGTADVASVAASGEGSSADFGIVHVTAKNGGAAGNVNVVFVTGGADAVDASVPGTLTITAQDNQALSAIATYVTNHSNFTMTASPDGTYSDANDTSLQAGFALTNGADAITAVAPTQVTTGTNNGIPEAAVFNLTGDKGSSVIQLTSTMSVADAVKAINAVSDSTGITAGTSTTGGGATTHLTLTSADYGKSATVQIKMVSGGATFQNNMKDRDGNTTLATTGTDVDATVNGVAATGAGNSLSIATPALSMDMQVAANLADSTSIVFTINGGGALYQLGSNINTNNQANMGIQAVDTGNLGGAAGLLYQLATGNDASLTKDTTKASNIVDDAVNQITSLRGRLGAFQKTTLETNIASLGDTVNALTNAQSTIQDADFAAETANLTRAQILVQSGTAVLQIANRGPQQVMALLQNL